MITHTSGGFDIEIQFLAPLSYQQHAPKSPSSQLEIFLKPEAFTDTTLLDQVSQRTDLIWDTRSDVPLSELVYNSENPARPSILLRFNQALPFTIRSSSDFRSIIISVIQSQPNAQQPASVVENTTSMDALVKQLKDVDLRLGLALEQANTSFVNKEYSQAVRLFSKVRDESDGEFRRRAQELIGVSRLLNNQVAQAKAEFERYLEDYPESEGAPRVRQRLNALITAAQLPKQKLRKSSRQPDADLGQWRSQFYGSFGQTYYRDQIKPDGQASSLIREDLTNDLDFIARFNKDDMELKTQFVGSYRKDLLSSEQADQFIPSIFWVSAQDKGLGLSAQLGRQSSNSSGTLGRFDGALLGYQVSDNIELKAVMGYPVNYSDKASVNTDVQFAGVSARFDSVWDGLDLSSFFIQQDNHGVLDRRAIGGEIRYRDDTKSVFTLLDYDLLYQELNIFLLIGNWTISPSNTANLVVDYRNSPLMTTQNALMGQGVSSLDQLLDIYTLDEIHQLARDRTAQSRSITAGFTHQFNQDWQVITDVTSSRYGDTPASGGVEALTGTENEMMYSVQVIGNRVAFETDTLVAGLRFANTTRSDNYSVNMSWRFNLSNDLRINPRIRVDYRKDVDDSDSRLAIRPFIRLDYRFKKWLKFEMDLGYEWHKLTFSDLPFNSTGIFGSLGYRMQF